MHINQLKSGMVLYQQCQLKIVEGMYICFELLKRNQQ